MDAFDREVKTIGKHIGNSLKEELDNSTVAKFATVQNEGEGQVPLRFWGEPGIRDHCRKHLLLCKKCPE